MSEKPAASLASADMARKNKRTMMWFAGGAVFMLLLSFASVPLYSLFCKVTGFGGQTQVAKVAPQTILDREITVRFNTDVSPELPWQFHSTMPSIKVKLGEVRDLMYVTENKTNNPYTGISVYNVLPERAGLYFNKIVCFCFAEKKLEPHERAEFPVQFFIDPAMAKDTLMDDVNTITLSYTFFSSKSPKLAKAQASFEAWQTRMLEAIKASP